jgi:hypothetical protein
VGRHHRPDSGFDEEAGYPDERTPRAAYRQGVLTGMIITWALLVAGVTVYLVLIR